MTNKNQALFTTIVTKNQEDLKQWLHQELEQRGYSPANEKGFLYAAGDVPVLLVAHLDTVHRHTTEYVCWDEEGDIAMAPDGIGGDDRCGVYMILRILEHVHCHVLFTEDEETGGKGAYAFADSGIFPEVNFILEFDRMDWEDAVFYGCDNPEFVQFIEDHGFVKEWGSFSDISVIAPALGIAAVNLSSGYYNAHTLHEYVSMHVMERNIDKALAIIADGDQRYAYMESPKRHTYYLSGGGSSHAASLVSADPYTDLYDDPYDEAAYHWADEQEQKRKVETWLEPLMPLREYKRVTLYDEDDRTLAELEADDLAIDQYGETYILKKDGSADGFYGNYAFYDGRQIVFDRSKAQMYRLTM